MRRALAKAFRSEQVVVPLVDKDFAPDSLEGLPDDIRALARQQLVVLGGRESASAPARPPPVTTHAAEKVSPNCQICVIGIQRPGETDRS